MVATTTSFPPATHMNVAVAGNADMPAWLTEPVALVPEQLERVYTIGQRAERAGLPVQYAFSGPTFDGQRRFTGANRDWYFMRLKNDPTWQAGKYSMPRRVVEDLQAARDAGIFWDDTYIAHETAGPSDGGNGVATLEMLTPPPSQAAQQASANLGAAALQFFRAAALPLLGVGAGLAAAVAVGGLALAATPLLLDPILYGAIVPDRRMGVGPGIPAAFIYLTHWIPQ